MGIGKFVGRGVLWIVFGLVSIVQVWLASAQLFGHPALIDGFQRPIFNEVNFMISLILVATVISIFQIFTTIFRRSDLVVGLLVCFGLVALELFLSIRLSASLMKSMLGGV
jgi:hypothetical protein